MDFRGRILNKYMYVRPRNTRTEMYASLVACCPLVSHVEYTPHVLLRLEKRQDRQTSTDRRTDGRTGGRTDARPLHYYNRLTRPA